MAKDPAFLFYPGDWLGGTIGMTLEEKGAYMELLMMQFSRGHMTSHMVGQAIGQLWDKVKDKFEIDEEGKFFNRRLDLEKERRKAFTTSRNNNLEGVNQYTKKKGHKGAHMTPHMENRNEDGNRNEIGIEERKSVFILQASIFRETYSDTLLQEFCEYWTEYSPNGKKMRFEKQEVFDISRRLKTWEKNNDKFNSNGQRKNPQDARRAELDDLQKAALGVLNQHKSTGDQ